MRIRIVKQHSLQFEKGAGFTLVEIIIYTGILSFILIAMVTLTDIVQGTRTRFIIKNLTHTTAARSLKMVNALVRNADGFVQDTSGVECVFSDKIWLYYATSSIQYLPPGCMGNYSSGALSIEPYNSTGATSTTSISTSRFRDFAIDDKYFYGVGWTANRAGWHLEKRFKSDLTYDTGFGTSTPGMISDDDPVYDANGIVSDGQYLYVVGGDHINQNNNEGLIKKYRITDGSLVTDFGVEGATTTANLSAYRRAAVDNTYLYVIGYKKGGAGYNWIIEKRLLTTGALDTSFDSVDNDGWIKVADTTTGTETWAGLNDIAIDIPNGHMYIAGELKDTRRIEKRLLSNGDYVTAFGSPNGYTENGGEGYHKLVLDDTHIYAVGGDDTDGVLEKRLKSDGTLVAGFGTAGVVTISGVTEGIYGVAVDKDAVYITYDLGSGWLTEKRSITTGQLVAGFGTGGTAASPSNSVTPYAGVSVEDPYIYIVGNDNPSPRAASLEKRSKNNGALDERNGLRLMCYQDYPNQGKPSSCAEAFPPHSDVSRQDITDPIKLFTGLTDFKITTTTAGTQQAFEAQFNISYRGSAGLFGVATVTASTTARFRASTTAIYR